MAAKCWQYYCRNCGNLREGLLDHPHGIGGYSWACPECKSHDISSRMATPTETWREYES